MKKSKKIVSAILCVCLAFSVIVPVAYAESVDKNTFADKAKTTAIELSSLAFSKTLNFVLDDVILHAISSNIKNFSFIRDDSKPLDDSNFYPGDNVFLPLNSDKYIWNLGYASASILPDDFGVKNKYARGSYMPDEFSTETYPDDDGNPETMMVRTIVFDDNTGRGSVVISSVDCIGISNTDVLKIRAALKDVAKENNIKSINVSAIHSHMAIDSQGVWDHPISVIINNILAETFLGKLGVVKSKSGVDEDYLNKIIESTKETIIAACADKKPGTLEYTKINIEDYVRARTISKDLDTNMHKLYFAPSDGSKSTLIASFGCHPEITSYGAEHDTRLSSDFVYYMEKLVNIAGSNFIYIQGNVGTNSATRGKSDDGLEIETNNGNSARYGYELAYFCLGASMDEQERIALNRSTGDKLGVNEYAGQENYTIWYEGLETFEPQRVEAVLNIKSERVKLEVENDVSLILLKLGLASNDLSYNSDNGKYYTTTEIGYMQLGTALQVFFSPCELFSELVVGGVGLKYTKEYKSLRETYGNNVIVFDLMNDAGGYVCPDETYGVIEGRYDFDEEKIRFDTWNLLVSMGKHTASTLMKAYSDLVSSTK